MMGYIEKMSVTIALGILLLNGLNPVNAQDNCDSLDGLWHNRLGSQMNLTHLEDGTLRGEYITAVESEDGASGGFRSDISGVSQYEPGAVFGFGVMWSDGASTTTWTGQCHMCDGKAVLVTSWILRSHQWGCDNVWMATRIGQDHFTREESLLTANADDDENLNRVKRRDVMMQTKQAATIKRSVTTNEDDPVRPCPNSLEGDWYNELGSKLTLTGTGGFLEGEYQKAGDATVHKLYGTGNKNDVNTTMSIFVAWPHGKSVTGWNAQCHLCGESKDVETLEAVWLMRHDVSKCDDNWKATLHGANTFTRRHDENERNVFALWYCNVRVFVSGKHEELGINTPGQAGEDIGYFIGDPCVGKASRQSAWFSLLLPLLSGTIVRVWL